MPLDCTVWRMPTVLVVAIIVGTLIAGCGQSPAGHPATSPIDCGSVTAGPGGMLFPPGSSSSGQAAMACFWKAYQDHRAATLTYTVSGVDTISTHKFVLQFCQNNRCMLSDSHDTTVAPRPIQHVGTYVCSALSLAPDGSGALVAENCGRDGDIVIPAK